MKIVVSYPIFLSDEYKRKLEALGNLIVYDSIPISTDELINRIEDADIVIAGRYGFSHRVLEASKKLKMISVWQTGYDHIDLATATKNGIVVCNVPHYAYDSVAEMVFALILNLAKRVHLADIGLRNGNFDWHNYIGIQLMGKTIGIVGLGDIGKRVAQIAQGFSMNVITYTRHCDINIAQKMSIICVDLDTLLETSDIITLHVPHTLETEHMIGTNEFARMKKSAIFINTARGKVVDEEALIKALKEKQIGSAGLDVFEREPLPLNSPLLEFDNVVVTPHIAFSSYEALEECTRVCIQNIEKFIEGKPQNVVNEDYSFGSHGA
jgi:phosphoglycerate dehydrogenase-like enzyme